MEAICFRCRPSQAASISGLPGDGKIPDDGIAGEDPLHNLQVQTFLASSRIGNDLDRTISHVRALYYRRSGSATYGGSVSCLRYRRVVRRLVAEIGAVQLGVVTARGQQ